MNIYQLGAIIQKLEKEQRKEDANLLDFYKSLYSQTIKEIANKIADELGLN
jgi:hypothetical protein